MAEDAKKIADKIKELNVKVSDDNWVAIDGNHAITRMSFQKDGSAEFTPSSGIPLKVFINAHTGEVKTFFYSYFEVSEDDK